MARKVGEVNSEINIRWPICWILLAGFLLYIKSVGFGFTDLDDRIFIIEFQPLLSKLSNLPSLFSRGVFNATQDFYYRPVLMLSLMLDAQVAGVSPKFYHFINILLHLISASLFYLLLIKLKVKDLPAFLLALIFVVHPVLTQAVVWIPGRNDSLLAVFGLLSMLPFIRYSDEGKKLQLFLHFFFLIIALLTKETAIAVPLICLVYLLLLSPQKKIISTWLYFTVGWLVCIIGWYLLRSLYTISKSGIFSGIFSDISEKAQIFLGYLGKIFFPYNLSVFPIVEDTSIVSGFLAIALITALIWFSKDAGEKLQQGRVKMMLFGFLWFLLFLLPVLIIPHDVNDQNFEHRLYLPLMGMMIVLSQTFLFNNTYQKRILISCLGVAILFAAINYNHAKKFKSEIVFWENAVKDSPHSSYAQVRLGSRYFVKNEKEKSELCFAEALAINPEERYGNYFLGKIYLEQGKVEQGQQLLVKEESLHPGYADNIFELAHAAFIRNNKDDALKYLLRYSNLKPDDQQAHNNLYLLYYEKGDYSMALKEAEQLKRLGVPDADIMMKDVQKKQALSPG
jgi:protein O-mannosyl-transferase